MSEREFQKKLRISRISSDYNLDSEQSIEDDLNIEIDTLKKPSLPVIILLLAVVKDLIDIAFTVALIVTVGFTGIFTFIIGWGISALFAIIIGVWITQKVGIVRKLLFKKVIVKTIIFLFFGSIPGIKAFPEATLLVFLTHLNEVKIVNQIYSELEALTFKK